MSAEHLPAVNAALNALSTALLVCGYVLVRRGRWRAHGMLMAGAFVVSTLFLVGYVAHKTISGDRTSGLGPGPLRTTYYAILIPHVVLAMVMLPMILTTLYLAARRRWSAHRRLARWTLPVWLYVSVTGVVIYWMLYHLFPALGAA